MLKQFIIFFALFLFFTWALFSSPTPNHFMAQYTSCPLTHSCPLSFLSPRATTLWFLISLCFIFTKTSETNLFLLCRIFLHFKFSTPFSLKISDFQVTYTKSEMLAVAWKVNRSRYAYMWHVRKKVWGGDECIHALIQQTLTEHLQCAKKFSNLGNKWINKMASLPSRNLQCFGRDQGPINCQWGH